MKRLLLALLLGAAAALAQEKPSCVTHCHTQEGLEHAGSVHAATLTCVDCHGGNPAAQRDEKGSHDPASGYVGRPPRTKIAELCGSCHSDPLRMHAFALPTDQLAQYRDSSHGRALFGKGDTSVAVCTDCHGTHDILPAADARAPTARVNQPATCGRCHADALVMEPHGLPSDSVTRFTGSVHGRALLERRTRGAPSCSDCHGSHGATPPGVGDIVQVCGHCHENTREYYQQSAHGAAGAGMSCAACHQEEKGYAWTGAGCTACHGTHEILQPGDWMLEGDAVGHCGHCHREDPEALHVATEIREGRQRLRDAMGDTVAQIRDAKAKGLFLDHEEVYLRESSRALVSTQPLTHSLDLDAIGKHLEDGLKRQDRTREMIDKKGAVLRDRRIVLGALAAFLLLLAWLLRVKLRVVRRLS